MWFLDWRVRTTPPSPGVPRPDEAERCNQGRLADLESPLQAQFADEREVSALANIKALYESDEESEAPVFNDIDEDIKRELYSKLIAEATTAPEPSAQTPEPFVQPPAPIVLDDDAERRAHLAALISSAMSGAPPPPPPPPPPQSGKPIAGPDPSWRPDEHRGLLREIGGVDGWNAVNVAKTHVLPPAWRDPSLN